MFDINLIREQPDQVRQALIKRNMDPKVVDEVNDVDVSRRTLLTQVESLKAERNRVSKEISQTKDAAQRQSKIEAMRQLGDQITELDNQAGRAVARLHVLLSGIPNMPDPSVPVGKDEHDNVIVQTFVEPRQYDFTPIPHWDLGPKLGIINFDQGVKLTGSRFYVLSGAGARIQRALIAYMLDLHIRQGYLEKYTPFMVKSDTMFASGQLPKFEDNLYHDVEEDYWMVPTAEVPLTSLHRDDILEEANLPLRYTAYTPCFRREKMSAGRDVRGIKRGHQFDKVEMYAFTKPEEFGSRAGQDAERRLPGVRRPWAGVSHRAAVYRRPGFQLAHHLRSRSLGAGLRRMVGGFVGFERRRFPGSPRQHQVSPGGWRQSAPGAYPQRLRPGLAAHLDRRARDLPAGRWLGGGAGSLTPMDGRR